MLGRFVGSLEEDLINQASMGGREGLLTLRIKKAIFKLLKEDEEFRYAMSGIIGMGSYSKGLIGMGRSSSG
ncbi:MAG: hypothetical protein QXH35_06280 [Nitrososphaerota archaeon]